MRPQSILNLHFWFARAFREWREKTCGRKNNDHWTQDEFRRIVHPENNDHWTQDEIVHPDARRF
jgi:hypothetical protein